MNYYVGIDNGINGGIVVIDENLKVKYKYIMPVIRGDKNEFDVVEIRRIFETLKMNILSQDYIYVILEKASPRPIQGVKQAFVTGECYGIFKGILAAKYFSFDIVNPQTWMKKVFEGFDWKDKKASIMYCQRKWPEEDWKATDKTTKNHDGLTDAACIAYYSYLINKKVQQNEQQI